jgi:hypothetical protein
MADLAALEKALRNADAAGDVEAAKTLVQAIKSQQGAPKASGGFGMGLADPIHGGAQLLTKLLPDAVVQGGNRLNNWIARNTGLVAELPAGGVDQQVREREAAYQAQRGDSGVDWSRLAGNVLNPANLAIAATGPAGAATLAGRVAQGAGMGAASSLSQPVAEGSFAEEKAKQIGMGAVGGAAAPALMAGLGRVISPAASVNPQLQALKAEGIRPTIGQTLGGAFNRIEEKAISLPLVGDSIAAARKGAAGDLNTAVANRALEPIGKSLPKDKTGREAVTFVKEALGDAYDALLPKMTIRGDRQFGQDLSALSQQVQTGSLNPQAAGTFARILQGDVLSKFRGQQALTGQTLKDIESDLGQQIARFGASQDPDARLVGDALKEVQSSLRKLAERNNPQLAGELKAINTGYANFKRMERAASYMGAEDGIFSAGQLQSAVKAMDRSKDKGRFARGDALMQDLSDSGKSVLGDKVPNSGTADRLMNIGAAGASFANPAIPLGLLLGAGAYSRPVQSLLSGAVSSRPSLAQPVAGLLNKTSPVFSPALGLLGVDMLN